jgi:O-antigen/teichoic acid export membrane protein
MHIDLRGGETRDLGIVAALSSALQRIDIWVAALFLGGPATGVFGAARRVSDGLTLPSAAVGAVALGAVARAESNEQQRVTKLLSLGGTAITAMPAMILCIAPAWSLRVLYGPSFADGASTLRILAIATIVSAPLPTWQAALVLRHARRAVRVLAAALLATSGLVAVGAKTWGEAGAAAGHLIGSGVAALLMHRAVKRSAA